MVIKKSQTFFSKKEIIVYMHKSAYLEAYQINQIIQIDNEFFYLVELK